MCMLLWLALYVTSVCSQHTNTKLSENGAAFGWGWLLPQAGTGDNSLAQYYIKLPQSEQQVQYGVTGDITSDIVQAYGHAFGHRQRVLSNHKVQNVYEIVNSTQVQAPPLSPQPFDIYLLQQGYVPFGQTDQIQPTLNYNSQSYNMLPTGSAKKTIENALSLRNEEFKDNNSPIQIFKDHNITETNNISEDLQKDLNKSKELFAEISSHDLRDINNFATTLPQTYSYSGAVKFKVETPRSNAHNEKSIYTTVQTPTYAENTTLDGIEKLVASTQNLISDEDLLFINNAAEKIVQEQLENNPRLRNVYQDTDANNTDNRNHITVRAKIENIVTNDERTGKVLQSVSDKYDFATPIVVSESPFNKFREQLVDNLVSTMVPYTVNGYEIVGMKKTLEDNGKSQDSKVVNVTPRWVHQNFLAPFTVALRLINANDTELFNTIDDYEASDSELISETVKSPSKEKIKVEVQKSIPVDIIHINDVEVHEYIDIDEGRNNKAESLYDNYVDALKFNASQKIQENMYKLLYKYGTSQEESNKNSEIDSEQLEQSENVESKVEVKFNGDTQRSENTYYDDYGNNNNNNKIIQPIIIEKEIPVTKFVDRYIEKKVPYPQQVEVQIPIDRPVPVSVPVEKIVEKPVEVTKYVDQPYPVEIPHPYPIEVKVPYPVEHKVYVDRPIHVPYPVEKVVEKQVLHPVPVPTPVGIPIEVPFPVEHKVLYPIAVDRPVPVPVEVEKPVEKIVHKEVRVPYAVEKKVPYPVHYETRVPVPYPVEKRIPVPVEKIVEKPVTVTKFIEKPIHIQVPVPQPVAVPVHVPQPYAVERIVEKKIPYPVPVDRIVEKPVQVPYPVEKIVEKIVEKPVVITKYVDKPYPVEKKVPYAVEKIVEKKVPYPVQVPIEVKVPYPVEKIVERPVHIPVPYVYYSHSEINPESKNYPQYQNYEDGNQKKYNQQQIFTSLYYQMLKEKLRQPVQSTQWGNQYASSYQYINNTVGSFHDIKKKYHIYPNNAQSKSNEYYGPVPLKNQDDWWEMNKNYIVQYKMSRSDREPKMSNLRIEYGGFKPPLIPSTEVDLDGKPINKVTN